VSEDTPDDLEVQLRGEQLDRLVLNARVFLRQGRLAEAQAAIDELRALDAESADAWELQGDIHRRQGDRKAAREAYQTALKLDPTNSAAERKYAEIVLFLGEEDRARREQRELVDDPSKHPTERRSPALAVIYASLFPGLGQLYGRQHEKGLAIFFAGAVILILLINGIIVAPFHGIAQAGRRHGLTFGEQYALWAQNLHAIPWWHWVLAVLGSLAYVAMYVYGIIDAVRVARQEAKEADRLGIDARA
jgi:tetratricopeptide (TPR) repeat protein